MNKQAFIPVCNYLSKETWTMQPISDSSSFTEDDITSLVRICNEPEIYDLLFKRKLENKPYSVSKAQSFVDRGTRGWREDLQYPFIIRDTENKIAAAIDIKSSNRESSEIGYWASNAKRGIMTNAVLALCEFAKMNGYKSLFALTRSSNRRSANVLERAHFNLTEEAVKEERGGFVFRTYTRILKCTYTSNNDK